MKENGSILTWYFATLITCVKAVGDLLIENYVKNIDGKHI